MCEQVEERLEFFETGVATRKNEEVMREAVDEYKRSIQLAVKQKKKKNKKQKKKEALKEVEVAEQVEVEVEIEVEVDQTENANGITESPEVNPVSKKKSKKKRTQIELLTEGIENYEVDSTETTPKRRKKLRTSK